MRKTTLLFCFLVLSSCGLFNSGLQEPKREFRGVWIATVVNIDWPKKGSDPWEKQKADYLKLLEFYKQLHFNAVIVQIRTAGDAFYPSEFAPWSRFLTGREGKAPETDQDPLTWMIREAHLRGFEFHAWLNPYRATFDLNTEVLADTHDFKLHPEWMIKYGKKHYYNPGLPEVRKHLINIMDEVVTNYDVDAIHFDDYFYPYKVKGEIFQDSMAYADYGLAGQSLQDWRRSNVDSLIKNIQYAIKKKRPWVQFGVSPFGVWKNKSTDPRGSDTRAGQTTYEDLYADPLLWMQQGWIDYIIPQLYWSMEFDAASHQKLLEWWASESANSNLYIGNGAYKIRNNSDKAWRRRKELPKQLQLARKTSDVKGNAFFSAKSLIGRNPDVLRVLRKRFYNKEALPPRIHGNKPRLAKPELQQLTREKNFYQFSFDLEEDHDFTYALVYDLGKKSEIDSLEMKQLLTKIYLKGRVGFNLGRRLVKKERKLALSFLDHYRRETEPIIIHLNQIERDDSKK